MQKDSYQSSMQIDKNDSRRQIKPSPRNLKLSHEMNSSRSRVLKRLYFFLNHWVVISVTTLITVFVLFADDLRQLTAGPDTDSVYYILILICFGVFIVEIVLSSIAVPNYTYGFYFWLDIISTATLLMEVGWISGAIFGTNGAVNRTLSSVTLARAARASKIGSRAGRIVRILRLIKLIRITKLYKASEQAQANTKSAVIKRELKGAYDSSMPNNSNTSLNKEKNEVHESKNERELFTSNRKSIRPNPGNNLSADNRPGFQRTATKNTRAYQENAKRYSMARMNSKFSLIDILEDNQARESNDLAEALKINEIMEKSEIEIGPIRSAKTSENEQDLIEKETNVGKKLSDMTTKRVVIIVLIIMLSATLFNVSTYIEQYSNYIYGAKTIYRVFSIKNEITPEVDHIWDYYKRMAARTGDKLFYMHIARLTSSNEDKDEDEALKHFGSTDRIDELRNNELLFVVVPDAPQIGDFYFIAYFDNRHEEDTIAIISILRTLFVVLIMGGGALLFSKDATDLVLNPIENMLKKINNITENPLNAVKIEEEEAFLWAKMLEEHKSLAKEKEVQSNYETSILEKIIVKIGGLLALGFGEAGSEIIVQNMKGKGEIDPMIPGNKIMAVFGFCDIRNFTDTTEILQEDIMMFVNEIAEVVHSQVDKFGGSPNKNIGDAFLLVWKFKDENMLRNSCDEVELDKSLNVVALVDMAVFSFVKILADLYQNKTLEKYRKNSMLTQRIPGFRVRMGFGLNLGWAIEGAIGSEFKIDASYLSPHVNIASRLEAATKQYGVPILISEKIKERCSKEVSAFLRKIDCVTVKGSEEPIKLYTFDADCSTLKTFTKEAPKYNGIEQKKQKFIQRNKKKNFHAKVFSGKIRTVDIFKKSPDVMLMHIRYTDSFYELWSKGFKAYRKGDWQAARAYMEQTEHYIRGVSDGPSRALLGFMADNNYKAPLGWTGVRSLIEK